jgi:hypothetical protein
MEPGYTSKVDIKVAGASAWVPYAASSWSWDDSAPANPVDNTEGKPGNPTGSVADPAFGARLPGVSAGRLTLQAPAFDANLGEFAAPLLFSSKLYYAIRVYPRGRGPGLIMHDFPSCLCTRVGQNMGSPSNPVPTAIDFETDGRYTLGGTQPLAAPMTTGEPGEAPAAQKPGDKVAA